ncbi:MAG: CU044_2847 family protein [Cyanophyceae cyanobacterium]
MAQLVEFDTGEGGRILVEVEDVEEIRPISRAPNEIAATARKTFAQALDNLLPMIQSVKKKLDAVIEPTDEVEVKFSVKLNGEVGAVLTKVGGEANYEITLKWQKK